jgi:hypothetical protein
VLIEKHLSNKTKLERINTVLTETRSVKKTSAVLGYASHSDFYKRLKKLGIRLIPQLILERELTFLQAMDEKLKQCVECNNPFSPTRRWSKVCSHECRRKRQLKRNNLYKKSNPTAQKKQNEYNRAYAERLEASRPKKKCFDCGIDMAVRAKKRCTSCIEKKTRIIKRGK